MPAGHTIAHANKLFLLLAVKLKTPTFGNKMHSKDKIMLIYILQKQFEKVGLLVPIIMLSKNTSTLKL